MYRASREAAEAFRAEYATSTAFVVAALEEVSLEDLEDPTTRDAAGRVETALHYAAGSGCLEACSVLLQRFPQLSFQPDRHGHTPLMWAVRHGLTGVAELLVRHGADLLHTDRRGLAALHWAAALGFPKLCALLLQAPAVLKDVNRRCERGWTALHAAAHRGSSAICKALLDARADLGAALPEEAWTPLHLAAMCGHSKVIRLFASLASSEVLLAQDANGRTALDLAELQGFCEVAEELRDPEEAHQRLVCKWLRLLDAAGPSVQMPDFLQAALELGEPRLERVSSDALELSSLVTDLGYQLSSYVVEVHKNDGPTGAAPIRVYYSRKPGQRKIERLKFVVPNRRRTGQIVWEMGLSYQFRLRGCTEFNSLSPRAPRQVTSAWSEPAQLQRIGLR